MGRKTVDLCGEWRFFRGESPGAEAVDFDDSGWDQIVLPHCWNTDDTFAAPKGYYRGPGWYRRTFVMDAECENKTTILQMDGAFGASELWVNGIFRGRYLTGYTGCIVDISQEVNLTPRNTVAIRVDNSHSPDVLPAREEPDYTLFGGIYRPVRLHVLEEASIDQRMTYARTTHISKPMAALEVFVGIRNPLALQTTVAVEVVDAAGTTIARSTKDEWISSSTVSLKLEIVDPKVWSVDDPHLYMIQVALSDPEGCLLDDFAFSYGVREFRFDPDKGFFLNGNHLRLRGVNRHQCYPGLGYAVPEELQIEDVRLIKEMGANFVRASHYPQHTAFLDACDRFGVLVFEEIASWQTIGGEEFVQSARQMLREMILRDRNHPSIVLWGMMNEGTSANLLAQLNDLSLNLDPTRPTCYAENHINRAEASGTILIPGVIGVNYQESAVERFHDRYPQVPMLLSEYTNAECWRGNVTAEIEQVNRIAASVDTVERYPHVAGGALWSMHDYSTDYSESWPVQRSGVVDEYRLPKEAFYYLQARWGIQPVIHICGHWTWPGEEGRNKDVLVITNCDEVELFLQGASLGRRPGSFLLPYSVAYEPGVLKAVGTSRHGVVETSIETTAAPHSICLEACPETVRANGQDSIFVTLRVVDQQCRVTPGFDEELLLKVTGPCEIMGIGGRDCIRVRGGIGRIVLRSTTTEGLINVRTTGHHLKSNVLSIPSN